MIVARPRENDSATASHASTMGSSPTLVGRFIAVNRRICRFIDRCLPSQFSVDGNERFVNAVVPRYVRSGARVVDVGGGKTPLFSPTEKAALQLSVIGMDVEHAELSRAPHGAYDGAVVGDICSSPLVTNADLVVCMTVIEHVRSTARAVEGMARLVGPGGVIALLVPCRNALFARLNLWMPERAKCRLLGALYPDTKDLVGFRAYYDQCTPSALERVATEAGLRVVERVVYNWSGYFDFFVPCYVCWRMFSLCAVALFGADAADRFAIVLVRPG